MAKTISKGDTIKVDYTGRLENGDVFDSSEGREPLEFTVGAGQLIKGFDDAVVGMAVGDEKTVTIPPEEAYGERNEDHMVKIPRSVIPDDMPLSVGLHLQLADPNGNPVPATVAKIEEDAVTMDVNHELAGKTLVFDISVVEIS